MEKNGQLESYLSSSYLLLRASDYHKTSWQRLRFFTSQNHCTMGKNYSSQLQSLSATSFRIVQQLTTTATLSLILRKIGSQRRPAGHLPFTATIRVFWATIRVFWATIRFFELTAFQWDCKTPQKTRKTPNKTLSELRKSSLIPKLSRRRTAETVSDGWCSVRTRVYCWDELNITDYLQRGGVSWSNADTVGRS